MTPGPLGRSQQPHRAGLILGLGIGSLVINLLSGCGGSLTGGFGCFGAVISIAMAIIAWTLASADLRDMNAGIMDASGRETTKAGRICGIISLVITLLVIILALVALIFGLTMFGLATSRGW